MNGISDQTDPPSVYDCKVLDGAVVVHSLPTAGVSTFNEYSTDVFIPHIVKQLRDANRVDIVWDSYKPGSLKESTREKRGKGIRRKVAGQTKMPTNWSDFMKDPSNKTELFDFLTVAIGQYQFPPCKIVYVTAGKF